MKTYLRLIAYARPIGKFAFPYFIFAFLSILFGIANLALLIPLLDILFGTVKDENVQAMLVKPAFSFSLNYPVSLFNYYFSQFIVEYGKIGALKFVCGVVIGSVFLANLFKYLMQRILEKLKAHSVARLRQDVFTKALSLHLGYFSNERKGNIMSRITTDVQEVENSIASTFTAIFKDPINLVVYSASLFIISLKLTLFSLIVLPISGFVIAGLVKKMRKDARKGQESLGIIISILDETFGGMRVIKAFNADGYISRKFHQENERYKRLIRSMANKRELASPFSEFMGVTVVALILLYGGSLILSNQSDLSAAEFIAYIAIFSQVLRPAKDISNAISNIQRGIASGERVLALIDTPPAIQDKPKARVVSDFTKSITFDRVSFAYDNGVKVLKEVSFTLQKGKTIALVGPSGGGKSTIADLVPRFYDPLSGSVLIDGVDLRDCTTESIRNQMGIVTQESILFNDTIFNNIAFGKEATEEEVIQAAKIANAHQFIIQTANGYQTVIGDRGAKLSGGQRQRISIARAILKNPPILILDEATSALDTESEKLVQEALNNLMQNRTSLVIAHRLSTIQHADEILVVQNGQIVEHGNHDDLLEINGGVYKKLNMMQAI
ncbi:ABC transporter ATP-binding protein [Rhodocytophaga rosea]|uniref:ABC transporter ATP-binding protein n=1 Tax=Rhodocytophaga rosea TaxID=2704465 RepID=A0A6C0GGS3_9BACT|nr:ABC transporter ATP-binding protein [Rhodocytophaga rosea]QHT67075.1 ABC transporter ATP-binding protein [Rhodocytophaga rosea]